MRAAVCLAARAGDSLDRFIAALGADPDVEQFAVVRGSATLRLADIDVTVSTASDGRIAGISFGPGFELPVDGVSIGDTADTLREERGAPQREWPFSSTASAQLLCSEQSAPIVNAGYHSSRSCVWYCASWSRQ